MDKAAYIVLFITTADAEEARHISEVLLEEKKAACVNIVGKVGSLFRWEGKVNAEQESLLIVKTKASLMDDVVKLVKTMHSYEVPEIIAALPILGGNPGYLDWIDDNTA